MSGLAALVAPESQTASHLGAMLERMAHYPWLKSVQPAVRDPRIGLGIVTLPPMVEGAIAASSDGTHAAVLHGELYEAEAARRSLAATGAEPVDRSDAATLLAGWRHGGAEFLAGLHGEFSALIWDGSRRQLHVVTDRFGLRPVYRALIPGGVAVASEVKAVLALPGIDTRWHDAGVAQFFSFGHFYGDATLLAGVRALPAATAGTFDLAGGAYTEQTYWRPRPGTVRGTAADLSQALEDRVVSAVARRARPGERLGLSLSGGLDARTILAVMPDGRDLKTVSLGIDGSLDHKSAGVLAALAGVPHRAYVLDTDFLSTFERNLREMVRLTDGHYLDQGIVMPTMAVYRELGIEHLLRGHGGELLHMRKAYAFSLDEEAMRASEPQLRTWLLSHLTAYMLSGVPDDLFTIDLKALSAEALDRALARCEPTTRPVDVVWQLFVNERLHRETPLSMHTFGSFANVRQPFIDNDVIDVLLSMPAEAKLGDELQTSMLRHRRPSFLKVTNANTGAKLGAGPLATEIARFRMRVFAKLGVKGYQPYERLGLWLKRDLRGLVESTLTREALLDSGLVRPDVVRRTIQQHVNGHANHTFLLMALMVFALGQELRERPTGRLEPLPS